MQGPKPEEAVADSLFRSVVESLDEPVYLVDDERRIVFWNRAAETVTGYAASEVLGRNCAQSGLNHVDRCGSELCKTSCPLAESLTDGCARAPRVFFAHREGHRVPVSARIIPLRGPDGRVVAAAELFHPITSISEELPSLQDAQRWAFEDVVTGLPNRRFAENELSRLLSRSQHPERSLGVLFLDLDHFKRVNDRYGHPEGDRALRVVSATLSANLRPGDTVARWGGEEFIVLLPNVMADTLLAVAERLRALIKTSRCETNEGVPIRLTVSIGATMARHTDSEHKLLQRADELLYDSKAAGRDRITHDVEPVSRNTSSVFRTRAAEREPSEAPSASGRK
jgi:diguanylate cyclase (GGDEF)-like protein/PAS domain S-box-containing protein